jgi:hypothetical protein
MKCVALALFFFLSLSCTSAAISDAVRRSHFDGRSGNVVLAPTTNKEEPASVLLMQHLEHFSQFHHEDLIEDTNVANLIAHVFQVPPPSNEKSHLDIDRSSFPVISLFTAPAANLFITVEDIDESILQKYSALSLLKNRNSIKISPTFQSRDTLASVESMISGCPPSQHGIIGRSWLSTSGTESFAFKDVGTGSHADSLFDVFAMTSPESFIFSMSSDYQLAAALSVRPEKRRIMPNIASYYWNSKHQNFDLITRHTSDINIHSSRAEILLSLQKSQFYQYDGIEFVYDAKNMQIFVSVRSTDARSVPFDLNSEDDFRIFVEIFFIEMALKSFREEKIGELMKDENPDSFSFGFAGMRAIRSKYGVDSPQFLAALYLLDHAIWKLTQEISNMYDDRITSQVLCVRVPSILPEHPEVLFQHFDDILPSVGDLKTYLPDIYMSNDLSLNEEKTLVTQMNSFLEEFGLIAYWFGRQGLNAQEVFLAGKRALSISPEKTITERSVSSSRHGSYETQPRWSVRSWFGFKPKDPNETYTLNQVCFVVILIRCSYSFNFILFYLLCILLLS